MAAPRFSSWWRRVFSTPSCSRPARRRRATALRLEGLEDRLVPATFTDTGNAINIVLNQTGGENVSIHASDDDINHLLHYYLVLNNNDTWSGTDVTNPDHTGVTGSGTSTLDITDTENFAFPGGRGNQVLRGVERHHPAPRCPFRPGEPARGSVSYTHLTLPTN